MVQDGPPHPGWRIRRSEGLAWISCKALDSLDGVGHAFSTRCGPRGEAFDLGAHDTVDAPFVARRRQLCRAAGLAGQRPLVLQQVHGARVVSGREAAEGEPVAADSIVCLRDEAPGLAAAVRTADCVPILLADPGGRALAAVHAGWRGTAEGIATRAVAVLGRQGVPAGRLIAAIGPAIGPCCYEVGDDVAERVAGACGVAPEALSGPRRERPTLDLVRANRLQLRLAGLADAAIHAADWCTACHPELFYSYRRSGGPTGRLMACIGWAGASGAP